MARGLFIEWFVIFVLLPLLVCPARTVAFRGGLLLAAAAYVAVAYLRSSAAQPRAVVTRCDIVRVFAQLVPCVFGLVVLALTFYRHLWLAFPARRPWLWLGVMCLYPIFSALPQEFVYRRFYFRRYRPLFGERWLWLSSAVAFAWMHIVFTNYLAVFLTLIGGLFFAHTYRRTRSLWLVTLEHSLYGQIIFTIGFGGYFLLAKGVGRAVLEHLSSG
jgi:membrane protease YdiL (CAAX protease family)